MTHPVSRVRGTANAPPTARSSPPTASAGPGEQAAREALGDGAYAQLEARPQAQLLLAGVMANLSATGGVATPPGVSTVEVTVISPSAS